MKILVTGATGFIGSHLVERLRERGNDIVCVAKDELNIMVLRSLGVDVVLGDLNNGIDWSRILRGVDYIYHLAGLTRAKWSGEYYTENYVATKRFVEACLVHCTSLRRFIYVSSQTAAGPSPDGSPVSEAAPCHPVSHYGRSKLLAELEVARVRDRMPMTIVRPSAVYGPRERDWYEYFKTVKRGLQPIIGLREKRMSLIHVNDLVEGIILAGESAVAEGESYFLANEDVYTTIEIGNAIAHSMGKSPIKVRLPHAMVYLVGAMAELCAKTLQKQIFFNIQKVRESVQDAWVCSVEKAKAQLGYRQRIALDDGMQQTYAWYCKHGWL